MEDLVVDARMFRHAGIGTYLRTLLPLLGQSALKIHIIEEGPPLYSIKEQLWLPKAIPPCEVFWSPHFNVPLLPIRARRRLTTLHDLFHLVFRSELTPLQKIYASGVISQAVSRSDRLITISHFTRQELLRFFPNAGEKVRVIHHGPGLLLPHPQEMELPPSFFLFVGSAKPHKNLERLLHAFSRFSTESWLLIAGKKEGFIRGIDWERWKNQERVRFLGPVSDGELTTLYQRAEALVFPSLYEGWGFPPLEAMQCGCPVIASDAASIPEACGSAALYFDPNDEEQLLSQLKSVRALRAQLVLEGYKRIEAFSWQRSAQAHLEVIQEEIETARP